MFCDRQHKLLETDFDIYVSIAFSVQIPKRRFYQSKQLVCCDFFLLLCVFFL